MLKLITLDLDNTLWDVTPTLIKAEKVLAQWVYSNVPNAKGFYQPDNLLKLRRDFCQQNPDKTKFPTHIRKYVLEQCFLQAGVQNAKETTEEAFAIFYKERNCVQLFPEAVSILKSLSEDFKIIALSNGNADLSLIGIDQYFFAHFSAESTSKAKPDTTMFYKALAAANCSPQQTLHIGDHPTEDIEAANGVGIRTIWLNRNNKLESSLCNPTREINSLSLLLDEINKIRDDFFVTP